MIAVAIGPADPINNILRVRMEICKIGMDDWLARLAARPCLGSRGSWVDGVDGETGFPSACSMDTLKAYFASRGDAGC